MATTTIESAVPIRLVESTTEMNGNGHKRRDLRTVINHADEEAYQKALKATEGQSDTSTSGSGGRPVQARIAKEMTVEDIGGREREFTLEKNGFMLAKQNSKVILTSEDLTDVEKIKKEYYPEMEEWLKEVTGATRVKVYHHGTRFSTGERRRNGLSRDEMKREDFEKRATPGGAVFAAHVDQSSWAGQNMVHKHLKEDAEAIYHGRVMLVNAWRPIKTVYKHPFGVADASTIGYKDLVVRSYKYFDEVRETLSIKPNENHRWYYKFKQQADEVLIFKGYDNHGTRRASPHSAFIDDEFEDAEPRESIEVRALLLWQDDESVLK